MNTRRILSDLQPHLRAIEAEATRDDTDCAPGAQAKTTPDTRTVRDDAHVVRASIAACRRFQLASRAALIEALGETDPLARELVAEELAMLAKEMEGTNE